MLSNKCKLVLQVINLIKMIDMPSNKATLIKNILSFYCVNFGLFKMMHLLILTYSYFCQYEYILETIQK